MRRYVESLEKGTPNYDEMSPPQAAEVRRQLPQILQVIRSLGALKFVSYEHGTEDGADVYLVAFAHGKDDWAVDGGRQGAEARVSFAVV